MKITVLAEKKAIEYSKNVKHSSIFISITCPGEDDVKFSDNRYIKSIFNMKFNDTGENGDNINGVFIVGPKQDDFNGLKKFIDMNVTNDIVEIVVHCGAGVSRSAGTALAIAEYLGIDNDIQSNPNFNPNLWVSKLVRNELKIAKNESYYADVFK